MSRFGNILRALRKERGLTQNQLANELQFTRSTIANYEQGNRLPQIETLSKLADYFGVSIDYLLGRSTIRSLEHHIITSEYFMALILDSFSGKVINCSKSILDFYGFNEKEALGKTITELEILPKKQCQQLIKKTSQDQKYSFYVKQKNVNGEEKDMVVYTGPIGGLDDNYSYLIVYDISTNKNYGSETNLIKVLSSIVSIKFSFLKGYNRKVAELATEIGREMNLPMMSVDTLKKASLLKNIGYLKVPSEIINKFGDINKEEYNLIKKHPEYSCEIIKDIDFEQPIADIVLQHHERLDGSGYPYKLKEKEIMTEAKIIAVADTIMAMTSRRPNRPPFSMDGVIEKVNQLKGLKLDSDIVDIAIKIITN